LQGAQIVKPLPKNILKISWQYPALLTLRHIGTCASSPKERWQDFITKAQAFGLGDEMIYATPKPEEIEAVLRQLKQLGGDIELLADEIDDWKDMQSPPLNTLRYGRWTRWLEQSPKLIAHAVEYQKLTEQRKLRKP
jgi:hypothetical protein